MNKQYTPIVNTKSNGVKWELPDRSIVGRGFVRKNGKFALQHCPNPKCNQENYAISVYIGICAWCGFDANGE